LYSEREYTLLYSAVQLFILSLFPPTEKKIKLPQKTKEKIRGHVSALKSSAWSKKTMMFGGGHHQENSFSETSEKRHPPSPTFSLLQTYISVMNYLYKNL